MTPQYYFEAAHSILERDRSNIRVAFFLDFDGTLVPIMKNPEECFLSPDMENLLGSILASGRSAVSILSGRSLPDLRKRVSLRGAFYAGSHGLEISGPGIRFVHKDAFSAKPAVDAVLRNLKKTIRDCKGIVIEEKPHSFSLHYRNAAKDIVPSLQEALYAALGREPTYAQSLTVLKGKKVFEVLPRVSWGKGAAALHIMKRLDGEYQPVCVGDDATDETLFRMFYGTGVTVRVGPSRKTFAGYYLKGQWEVPVFLKQLAGALHGNGMFR